MRLTRRECEVEECHVLETPETAARRDDTLGHRSGPRLGVTEVGRPSVCEYTPARSPCEVCTAVSAVEIFCYWQYRQYSLDRWSDSIES